MSEWLLDIIILLVLFLLNGFFTMAEMAVVSARKSHLKAASAAGKPGYRLALDTAEHPRSFLSTIQIAVTLINLCSGAYGEATLARLLSEQLRTIPALAAWADTLGLVIVLLGLTFAALLIAELVPKQIALSRPEHIAATVLAPIRIVQLVLWPAEKLLSALTRVILALFRIPDQRDPDVTTEEIRVMLNEGEQSGNVELREKVMVEHVFHLGGRKIEAFMTHRSEMEWLPRDTSQEEILAFLHMRYRYRLIPVCKDGLDDVLGMVDSYKLLLAISDQRFTTLATCSSPALFIPASMTALKAMELFRHRKVEAGIVLDEYGGVMGMVDLQDLVSELSRNMAGTASAQESGLFRQEDGSWEIEGRTDIHDFCHTLALPLPPKSNVIFQTVAGYILFVADRIPQTADEISIPQGRFRVLEMQGNRIVRLSFQKNPAE